MFYIIGLGLSDEKDITLRGLEVCPPQPCITRPH
jgi:diphthamide biosynthesis methyltransferase